MSAESSGPRGSSDSPGRFTYWRLRFRGWRGTRPFWAGLFTLFSGFPIAYFPYAELKIGNLTMAMATTAGAGSLIIGVLLVTLGLTMWFHSIVRVFAGVATIMLSLVSIPVSNIGGFFIGFLFALIGGALSISWAPGVPAAPGAEGRTPHEAPGPDGAGDRLPFPGSRDGEDPNVTDTTAHANGGRNSAG
ncbi:DUF6114 domain-containing protein [Streptomyces sp. NPDC101062]|uniref:DUF6114 domain-containing protein n=1 Tax=unclassified Streptomyces TaxID=2593676 RepID=UPI002E76AC8D|nr:DUF6114 domain-containing protein [Streptomyces sp. JV176]MEE1804706.1 DUF6114 domain-containing protein [Streptomyces sp. JV176]